MKRLAQKLLVPGTLAFSACSPVMPEMDAGSDAGRDAGTDAGTDAGYDAGIDAGYDAGTDAGTDAGSDAGMDGGLGPCPHSSPYNPVSGATSVDDAGVRCECTPQLTGGLGECCDMDIGNPCPICCGNPQDPDAGREFFGADGGLFYSHDADAGQPVCLC
jgi:hypothetical protein